MTDDWAGSLSSFLVTGIDIHGTVGVVLWPIALLFGLYALSLGQAP
jgi:hypothetical protein